MKWTANYTRLGSVYHSADTVDRRLLSDHLTTVGSLPRACMESPMIHCYLRKVTRGARESQFTHVPTQHSSFSYSDKNSIYVRNLTVLYLRSQCLNAERVNRCGRGAKRIC
jgi:hypothetical protein